MPGWNYDQHPECTDGLLKQRALGALALVRARSPGALGALAKDTRPLHATYFAGLTPPDAIYFAGNYRGAPFPQLRYYLVQVNGVLGAYPHLVQRLMDSLGAEIDKVLAKYELTWSIDADLDGAEKLYRLAEVATAIFVAFLAIHPYADGNGHMGRLIILMVFARYNFKYLKMPLHPRPKPNPPLEDMIVLYRRGQKTS